MVHADVRACLRVTGASAGEKLRTIEQGLIQAAGDGTLIMPTFTYSFCRGEPFSVTDSPSTVGALGEHFRHRPDVRRTTDPLFSCAVRGDLDEHLFRVGNVNCFGARSIWAHLREVNATFVCLGIGLRDGGTFIHHIEQRHGVGYRYLKEFRGEADGQDVRAWYFVRSLNGPEADFGRLEGPLLSAGEARVGHLPNGPRLLVTDARSIEDAVLRGLRADPRFLQRSDSPRSRPAMSARSSLRY